MWAHVLRAPSILGAREEVCMSVRMVAALELRCERCGAVRVQQHKPKCCPRCKSPYWNSPRKISTEKAKISLD